MTTPKIATYLVLAIVLLAGRWAVAPGAAGAGHPRARHRPRRRPIPAEHPTA